VRAVVSRWTRIPLVRRALAPVRRLRAPVRRLRRPVGRVVRAARGQARIRLGPLSRRLGVVPSRWRDDTEVQARLTRVRWLHDGTLELTGWAFAVGVDSEHSTIGLVLARSRRGPGTGRIELPVRPAPSPEINLVVGDRRTDRSRAGFVVTVHPDRLREQVGSGPGQWSFAPVLTVSRHGRPIGVGTFTEAQPNGSVHHCWTVDVGDGLLVRPIWHAGRGFTVQVARRAVLLTGPVLDGSVLTFTLDGYDFTVDRALLRDADGRETEVLSRNHLAGGGLASGDDTAAGFRVDLTELVDRPGPLYLHAADPAGTTRFVHWSGPDRFADLAAPSLPHVRVVRPSSGVVRIDVAPVRVVVTGARVEETNPGEEPRASRPLLTVTGAQHGLPAGSRFELVGPRQTLTADAVLDDSTFEVAFALHATAPFAAGPTAPRVGTYALHAVDPEGHRVAVASVGDTLAATLPVGDLVPSVAVLLERGATGRFRVRVSPPYAGAERARFYQVQRRASFRQDHQVTDSVYLECFDGRSAGDSPLAIDAELARRRPDLTRFWAVADYSVEVPDDAVPLLRYTERWWTELARARYVVTNCWLVNGAIPRPYQTVLQTWHGTPYKRLGMDRLTGQPGSADRLRHSSSVWDLMISQNPFSSERFRSAYLFANQMLEIGYPRDDVLVTGASAERLAAIRQRLGIAPGQRVVAYLPTWRDDNRTLDVGLDPATLVDRLGPEWTLLLRGHSYTHRRDRQRVDPGRRAAMVDATMYPDTAELFLVADVLVTDYSSVMFDYSLTGKPMIFLTPDLEEYASQVRGAYFSLPDAAPGPCVRSTEEVAAALLALPEVERRYADAYAAWRSEFNPWDDGRAATRAVDALLAHRPGSAAGR